MKSIQQAEQSECGLACLAMIASHFGDHSSLAELRTRFSVSLKGATLAYLIRHAASMNLAARPLRLELSEVSELKCPCILHWDLNHFVVLKRVKTSLTKKISITIIDPAIGECELSSTEFSRHFTGVALELTPTPAFRPKKLQSKMPISQLLGRVFGLRNAIAKIIALALALEVFSIISPLFNQFIIDDVIVSGDHDLLKVMVIGFALILFVQMGISAARSWFLMRWSVEIGFQWTTRIFAHMVRLPISYFEKRHLGDVVSRFGSIAAIQSTLTSLFVESLLDGLMAILALGMMIMYSMQLSLTVILGVLLYGFARWIFYHPLREASRERLVLGAKENGYFLETIRAMTPLKLFGAEADRISRWQNLRQDVINRDVETQKLGIIFKISSTTISGAQGLIVFYVGANLVMANALSIGMLMAFSSYAGNFSTRVFNLVDLFINVRMLSMHAERLADIVREPAEAEAEIETDIKRLRASITLRNVSFRYADGEPWVLDKVNLHIPEGQSIALTGPSGCGKTTLCKIILGLISPIEGEIFVDNIPIAKIGLRAYRSMIGSVMQEDTLLSGSILENISFFDVNCDRDIAESAAKIASVHDEINSMPMGYQTLVGDMGSSLSGGQRQRILLARALYRAPRIVALDEATSHLDIQNEQSVNEALRGQKLTRIIIAHRIETINSAERVVAIKDGNIVEVNSSDRIAFG